MEENSFFKLLEGRDSGLEVFKVCNVLLKILLESFGDACTFQKNKEKSAANC